MASTLEWISLSLVPGLGLTGFWRLLDHFHSPAAVIRASSQELLRVKGIREGQVAGILDKNEVMARGERELARLTGGGAVALTFDDPRYPPLLRELPDPPPVLYVLGRPELLGMPSVAIVGSRAATTYGRRTAFTLAQNLAHCSLTVVSGLAVGIDTEAHIGSLAGRGSTVAVLGCGLDVVYPKQNSALYKKIVAQGALVSEYPLGTPPEGFRFPARNRIIAGLSLGVVVVEAAKRSGSLITAQIALDCGREVFAVPGQVDSCKSEGAHWLLKQGAKLVQSLQDIVEELGLQVPVGEVRGRREVTENHSSLEPDAVALLDRLEAYPKPRESLMHTAGMSPQRLSELLLVLELEGLVELLPGDKVRKITR